MNTVVTSLTTALTPTVFYGMIDDLVPLIIVLVPIALGLYFLRKLIKGASKGKVRF